MFHILIAISILIYFRIEQDYLHFAKLVKWTMIFILITAIMTIYVSLKDPLYVRNLTGIDAIKSIGEVKTILSYQKYGGGDYSFASVLMCLFPIFIYFIKNNSKKYFKKTIFNYYQFYFIYYLD